MIALALLAVVPAKLGRAQSAWVKDEVHLQIRSGAGNQYRIIGRIKTGDTATILKRGDGWTRIKTADTKEGWVPAGFLQPEPPARVALERLTRDTTSLREEVAKLTSEGAELRINNEELAGSDAGQRSQIDRLTRENYELRAGARWPEWITGGGIVLVGMSLGALLSRSAGRRRQPRIRL
jgi:SH3 domain protein